MFRERQLGVCVCGGVCVVSVSVLWWPSRAPAVLVLVLPPLWAPGLGLLVFPGMRT